MRSDVDVSIVIATKDRARYLERALASLERQASAPRFEVVVADNGSTDDTHAVAERQAARACFPVAYVYEPEPNRGKARNRGVAAARGELIAFCDDDVQAPSGWLAAHVAAHAGTRAAVVVNGPILNVGSYEERPKAVLANFSRAFLCTCNASLPRSVLAAAGGFDEAFDLYGWEDTELGVRLREAGVTWKFAWGAAIWHVKPPAENTLGVEARKALEKARMARRFIGKHPSKRARMATGAYGLNVLRGRYFLPDSLLAAYAGIATSAHVPAWVRSLARAQFLDGIYTRELFRALAQSPPDDPAT
jgi:glycosyltransferase involved in cell wall biosynthesis